MKPHIKESLEGLHWGVYLQEDKIETISNSAEITFSIVIEFSEWKESKVLVLEYSYPFKYKIISSGKMFESSEEIFEHWLLNIYNK